MHLSTPGIYWRLRNCPYTLQTLTGWTAIKSADQPVRPLQVDGQVLNLPLYVGLTDNFRCTEPYFEIFVLNLVTFTGWRTIFGPVVILFFSTWRCLQVDGQFWAHSNIQTYKKIVKNYGDVYRLTDTPFTCKGLQVYAVSPKLSVNL